MKKAITILAYRVVRFCLRVLQDTYIKIENNLVESTDHLWRSEMSEAIGMTREEIIEKLAEHYVRGFTDTDSLDAFVKNVVVFGWPHKPYKDMDNFELFAEWEEAINFDGEYPIFMTDIKEV